MATDVQRSLMGSIMSKGSIISKGSMSNLPLHSSTSQVYIYICCVGSMLFGYGISYMNTMKKPMTSAFNWNETSAKPNFSWLTTAVFAGAAMGSFVGGEFSKRGRRFLHLVLHSCFIAGGIICALAFDFWSLLVGRLATGFAVGLVTVASPMIISEVSPLQSRGANGVKHQLSITVGILFGLVLGTPFNSDTFFISHTNYMRFMLGLPAILSVFVWLLIMFVKTADTPNYYISIGKRNEARQMLREIYQKSDIETEFRSLVAGETSTDSKRSMGFVSALGDKWYRKAIFVGIFLALGQQLSGINAFVSLSNSVFQNAGLSGRNLSVANTLMSCVNCLMTFPAIYVIEAFGRKPLYIIGSLGMTIALSLVPIAIMTPLSAYLSVISVISVVGFIVFFAVSAGPVLWVYLNEIFPAEIAGTACGVCCALNWIAGICVVFGVSWFEDPKYTFAIFSTFTICSALVTAFCLTILKETKGRSNADSPYFEGRNRRGECAPLTASASGEKYV